MKDRFYARKKIRGHPGLNQGPLDLQSNALPLSYIPMMNLNDVDSINTTKERESERTKQRTTKEKNDEVTLE